MAAKSPRTSSAAGGVRRRSTARQPDAGLTPATRTLLAGAALCLLVVAGYWPALTAGYIWDDDQYVTANRTLESVDGLRRIWTELGAVPQYYPLVHTTFWIERRAWGLDPRGYHAVNVLLHAASAILLWRLLARLHVPGAWFAAALFGLHPVEVESVAWITERKNVLSLFFALGSMLCYLRFAPAEAESDGGAAASGARRCAWYGLALALFAMALLSKTVVATLPAVLLVIYWWKRGRITPAAIAPLVPFFVVAVSLGLITVWMEKNYVGAQGKAWTLSAPERVLLAGRALWFYAGKLAWPAPLIFFYPRWTLDTHQWWQWLFPAAAVAVIIVLWRVRGVVGRGPLAAVLIFAGVLLPALGFFDVYPFRFSYVADHFQYHASIALLTLFAAAAAHYAARQPRLSIAAAAIMLITLGTLTCCQTFVYRDLEALYADTIAKNPTGWTAYSNLACHLWEQGRADEAIALSRKALEYGPQVSEVQSNIGGFLLAQVEEGRPDAESLDAIVAHFESALQLNPRNSDAAKGLAFALIKAGRFKEAEECLARRLQEDPRDADALFGMGRIREATGRPTEAEEFYERAVRLKPGDRSILSALEHLNRPRQPAQDSGRR